MVIIAIRMNVILFVVKVNIFLIKNTFVSKKHLRESDGSGILRLRGTQRLILWTKNRLLGASQWQIQRTARPRFKKNLGLQQIFIGVSPKKKC